MDEENGAGLRDLWLPGLVGLVGILISFGAWGLIVIERRDQILETSREAAAASREVIEQGLAQQVETLRGLSELWRHFGLRPVPEWRAIFDERVDRVTGLRSVTWVDLDSRDNLFSAGEPRSAGEIEEDVQRARRHQSDFELIGPERSASGAVGYRMFLPVETRKGHAGVLVGHFRVRPFLEELLKARSPGHAVAVVWDGQEIYARGVASQDRWQRWWRLDEPVDLPFGGSWHVILRPTSELAAASLTPIPHYLLAAAILLSLALAVAAHQLRVILQQARFLAASNRALEERGRELESNVAERTEALQDAVAELEAFNYSVSHDLRSPLGAIQNFAMILEEDYREQPLDGEALAILARIQRSASRATALLEDLLLLSRAGRAPLAPECVNMTALARESFAQARAAEEPDDGEDVEFVIDPLPEVAGDRTLLGDVFVNLFSNSLKYSRDREKRRIEVRGRADEVECVYEVSDNGQGFDMRFVDKVFGLFERLHGAEAIEGTGVGLAMVARIVRRHGGRVWAEGRPGEGARFSFSLPRSPTP